MEFTFLSVEIKRLILLDTYPPPFLLARPKLGEWWARIEGRPSFKEAGIVKEPIGLSTLAKKLCTIL